MNGKVAIVTGAGRGIGEQIALRLARDGVRVVVNDLDAQACDSTVQKILDEGGHALPVAVDLTDENAADQVVDACVEGFGGIDIVVNNAGYVWNSAMHKHSDEQWQAMIDMHATAPFRLLRACYPVFKAQAEQEAATPDGLRCRKVVNISSVSGTEGAATQIAYSAGKAAVVGMTKTLAKEWGRLNITVNCVAFGPISTRLTQTYDGPPPTIEVAGRDFKVGLSQDQVDAMIPSIPLGRVGQPHDAAGAVYLFCIPESDFVTGQLLICSGGLRG
ncbi:MAG: SDR family NAD(P)-dependent oxidoreductase [Pseudomonadota bacterium]